MVAGKRSGKTSFLRLLLDTSIISPAATKDQLASVAKFVQGSSGHTSHIRTASINIDNDIDQNHPNHRLTLTLVDTPSLDFEDDPSSERLVLEILRHVDSRFAEGIEDEWKAQTGDHHIHLCIYFLDPDVIVPPSVPGPPAPLVPRARTNSFSQPEPEPVILEPPVTTNPLLCRPTLPPAEISTIRRLSARVNVLPVIARADTLTNDRLAAVKMAVRRDLAEAGIGFGIFDMDTHPQYQHRRDAPENSVHPLKGELANGYGSHPNGSSPSGHPSPPTSPATPSFLRLPYALISPDIYSHSDGVARVPLSRHELIQQYNPSSNQPSTSKIHRGKFIRSYRWGSMDVLDSMHSDFLPLRAAIFHHMETLQKYTKEYLFDKFRNEYMMQHHAHQSLAHQIQQGIVSRAQLPALSHAPRPTLAIDTTPHGNINRHPPLPVSRDVPVNADIRAMPISRSMQEPILPSAGQSKSSSGSSKQRPKKITVACNFCRSRKLKCDGGRPACSQCVKRSNPCDYMPQNNKRRSTTRHRKQGEESDSEGGSGDGRSGDADDPSLSPEVPSQPLSRRSSNVDKRHQEAFSAALASSGSASDRRETAALPGMPVVARAKSNIGSSSAVDGRSLFKDNELPHIATLALPDTSPTTGLISGAPLPPIRPASEQQAAQRKRASTIPGRSNRQTSNAGPKVVACNFCRARKTKCDGAHPACSSCARRSLPCNYNHESSAQNGTAQKKGGRRASTSKAGPGPGSDNISPPTNSPQSSSQLQSSGNDSRFSANGPTTMQGGSAMEQNEGDLKRKMDDDEAGQLQKRMRVDDSSGGGAIP
ncbi:hypothetical protein SERLA73DRAFT_91480 [Serpula lacrymans var. lacrymans S7.3]|uniref:Zn(2)-C6 fungal-type domain-containing protein n=1 Tax=Serpula lacrymans var. lacrymans (strain S7.3) TaxID=936435 RepID=F8Q1P0_SERL3|nr:hypothetical protein SERLA73DRAFT_91480 [Serpula lacrymans var. lacrymans S7.3]